MRAFLLLLHLLLEPVLQAFVMNKADGPIALTRVKQWVRIALLIAPAYLALYIALSGIDDPAVNLNRFLGEIISTQPVLLILIATALNRTHRLRTQLRAEVLDLELDATELDYVAFAEFIVGLRCRRLQVPHDYEHLIVHVLVLWNRQLLLLTALMIVSDGHKSVVFHEKLSILLVDNDEGLGLGAVLSRGGLP